MAFIKKMFFYIKTVAERFRFGGDPDFDWKIILISFTLLNLIVVGVHVALFLSISNSELGGTLGHDSSLPGAFSRSELRGIVETYRGKAEQLEAIKKTPPRIADPSL